MLFKFFDATDAISFAREISERIHKDFPLTDKAKSLEKGRKTLDLIAEQTRSFCRHNQLNVYKKAKLLNTVKWQLRELGHDDLFVEEILRLLANSTV